MNKLHLILVLFCAVLTFGCTMLQKPCERTTDCGSNEVCKDGYCTVATCRQQNETCDIASDCCQNMTCDNNHCRSLQCPSCDDNDTCTTDWCNVTAEQCMHTAIPSCCGNKLCEGSENCGSCPADCPCGPGLVCWNTACQDETNYLINSIKENHSVETCRQKVLDKWELGSFGDVAGLAENCSATLSDAIGEIRALPQTGNASQRDAELLVLESKREELYFMHSMAETIGKRENFSKDEYDNLEYLQDMKEGLSHLENAMYKLYLIKTNSSLNWSGAHETLFNEYAGKYRGMNQRINALYDDLGSYDYKNAFHVDPNDPLVIAIADGITPGRSQGEIRLELLQYVYWNVEYVPDPNWQTDWVQPPAYTMMMGQGDCDDSAVLLASLFLRAGVENTELCEVDSDYDGSGDHLTVGVRSDTGPYMVYESVWPPSDYLYYGENETPPESPEPVSSYNYPADILYCYEPEEEISYALADKCSDGTPYGECSEDIQWFCDNGTLVADCGRCGCPTEYPHCATGGEYAGVCSACSKASDVWIAEYGVCCPKGYPEYDPEDETCRRD